MAQKILVVDDDVLSVKQLGLLLQRRGYEIAAATSGPQALEQAQKQSPDLIILDVMMPGMDGYEVCRRLRADPATASVPIIMLTAKARVDDKVTGFEAGADDYLTKPIHPDELASRVQVLLLRSARGAVEEPRPEIRGKVFGFLGAKGGVGTTTLAINVAVALTRKLAATGQVVLADVQAGMAASSVQLGLRHGGGLARLLERPVDEIEASTVEAQLDEHGTGVRVLSGPVEPLGVASPVPAAHAEAIVRHLGALADYLVLDLGVGLGEANRRILPLCDQVVVCVEPHRVALTLAQKLLDELTLSLELAQHRISVVLINKAPSAATFSKSVIEGLLQHDIIGVVTPAPELAFQAAENGTSMVTVQPNSLVVQQFRSIADYLFEA